MQSARNLLELSEKTRSASCEETLKKIVPGEETTCVADAPFAALMELASKMSTESEAFDAAAVDMLYWTQNLHMQRLVYLKA